MKVVWVSPTGEGAAIAARVRDAGHQVVGFGAVDAVPAVPLDGLAQACRVADLVVVDGPTPLVRTASSWRPAQDALFFDEMRRHHRVIALGPTPTIDLLVGDHRYLRKMCRRFDVPYGRAEGEPWSSGGWFRGRDIVPPGPYLEPWAPLFRAVGFRGWFALSGVVAADGPLVDACSASWTSEAVPEGREAEFLAEMAR